MWYNPQLETHIKNIETEDFEKSLQQEQDLKEEQEQKENFENGQNILDSHYNNNNNGSLSNPRMVEYFSKFKKNNLKKSEIKKKKNVKKMREFYKKQGKIVEEFKKLDDLSDSIHLILENQKKQKPHAVFFPKSPINPKVTDFPTSGQYLLKENSLNDKINNQINENNEKKINNIDFGENIIEIKEDEEEEEGEDKKEVELKEITKEEEKEEGEEEEEKETDLLDEIHIDLNEEEKKYKEKETTIKQEENQKKEQPKQPKQPENENSSQKLKLKKELSLDSLMDKKKEESTVFWEKFAVNISFLCNILLFLLKVIAAGLTLSLSIITSALDSFLDLMSGFILWYTKRARHRVKQSDHIKYPLGKSRYETLGFIIFACCMSTASVIIIKEGSFSILTGVVNMIFPPVGGFDPDSTKQSIGGLEKFLPDYLKIAFFWVGNSVIIITIVTKTILLIICFIFRKSPSVRAYMIDHRNDIIVNTCLFIAIIISGIFPLYCWWLDPLSATILSFYIIFNWVGEIKDNVKKLVGRAADQDFLNKVIYLAISHHEKIRGVESVQAIYSGEKLLVELDIIVLKTMMLKEAHDIGEELQNKIECLEEVERAFVHVDYESEHKKTQEHKSLLS